MKRIRRITLYIIPLLLLALVACTDDLTVELDARQTGINYRGEPVDAFLDISVGTLSVSMETRADGDDEDFDPYEDTEAERWVNDMWVFQYDEDGTAIADPIYLTITDQETLKNVPVVLSDNDGAPSLIYVVTNTSIETWGINDEYHKVEGLLKGALPTREPILVRASELDTMSNAGLSIPMEGNSGDVTVTRNKVITVPVARMYAKIMIDPDLELLNSEIYSVGIGNIPQYCQVGTLYESDEKAATYPETVVWISRTFTSLEEGETAPDEQEPDTGTDTDLGYRYIAYVPENIEGQSVDKSTVGTEDSSGETVTAPPRAFQVNIVIAHTDDQGGVTNYPYTVYPGADVVTDYNIKRNNVYRVKVKINTLSVARVPSANCLFGFAGTTISFFPYYRVETGGGYDFTDYLDPNGAEDAQTDSGAKIDHVGIVWQTKDCIGDNTNGDLVYLSTNSETHTGYEQIYVKTQKEGNALIAAYDTQDNIIWSWHIWVRTPGTTDPTNLANAKTYYTYYWDENDIYSYALNDTTGKYHDRVSGYQIMSCNLGALQDEPNFNFTGGFWGKHTQEASDPQYLQDGDGIVRTYGMLYQWGRKDPFPPMIKASGAIGNNSTGFNTGYYVHDYDDAHTDVHYGNDNNTVVHKTAYGPEGPTYSGATTPYSNYLFYTHIHTGENTSTGLEGEEGDDVISGMRYSIAHPTVFLCGVKDIAHTLTCSADNNYFVPGSNTTTTVRSDSTEYVKLIGNYIWGGAWSNEDHDDREWGGLRPDASSEKNLDLGIKDDAGNSIKLWDDYESGTDGSKSIFDPCPYGWRVGSSDLWLGFTKNGVNPYYDYKNGSSADDGTLENINYDSIHSCILGMYMYLGTENNLDWCKGDLSWFPTQGFRLPDGCGYRVGGCGNYVNANTDENERINIIHIHDDVQYFKQFEVQVHYTRKSTGNPLRCVRDTK